jgi:DNA-binding MarR family transcriptional regulator
VSTQARATEEDQRSDDRPPAAAGGSFAYLLKHAWLAFHELTGAALAPYGIDGRELAVLTLLDGEASLSQQQAAGRLAIDRTTMVAMVDGLEGKGLVERRTHPGDRRKNLVDLTAAGRRTLRKARRAYDDVERRFLAPLGEADARRLKDSLHTLITAAGREPGR